MLVTCIDISLQMSLLSARSILSKRRRSRNFEVQKLRCEENVRNKTPLKIWWETWSFRLFARFSSRFLSAFISKSCPVLIFLFIFYFEYFFNSVFDCLFIRFYFDLLFEITKKCISQFFWDYRKGLKYILLLCAFSCFFLLIF